MSIAPRPYAARDREPLHALMRDPSLESEFGWLLDNRELEDPMRHPIGASISTWVADGEGDLAGFASGVRFPSARGDWALLRVGVRATHRGRGLGRRLLEKARADAVGRGAPWGFDLKISHWEPNPGGEGFARAVGFQHDRLFWNMERSDREPPVVTWPPGIDPRTFDPAAPAFEDWNDCSNAAFASNEMSATSTVAFCRALTQESHFRPAGLLLAYRDGRCVGFCRCALHSDYGDLDVLGVVPEARGIGLGRALVRWGTAWLLEQHAPHVRLSVDGENTRALNLYAKEGFEIGKTRHIWKMSVGGSSKVSGR